MTLANVTNQRERDKFVEDISGNTAVRTSEVVTETNPSFVYTYTSGDLTKITMTIGAVEYEKTFTWDGDDLTGETVWSIAA